MESNQNGAQRRFLITGGSGFIGTHLVERLQNRGCVVLSIDTAPPKEPAHRQAWIQCDILSNDDLKASVARFSPTDVVHLAAKASLQGKTIDDFPENVLGTSNVVRCVNETLSVETLLHFSTQYVVRPGLTPKEDEFFDPYTPYGESKMISEQIVRSDCLKRWTICRPTNVWGPHHPFFPYQLWRYLERGYYFHPGSKPIRKFYAYIDNAIDQIEAIVDADQDTVRDKVFYLTDPPINNIDWMNASLLLWQVTR